MCLWLRVFVASRPVPSGHAIEIAASGHVSTATDASCGGHVYGIDATTLSAECQQPCQPSVKNPVNRASGEQPECPRSLRRNASWNVADQSEEISSEAPRHALVGRFEAMPTLCQAL
jgi:hypothetical protein